MHTSFFQLLIAGIIIACSLSGQSQFSFSIALEPYAIPGLDGIHSYASGQIDGKWVIIGGRLDGLHPRQPFRSFPVSQNNTNIYVDDS